MPHLPRAEEPGRRRAERGCRAKAGPGLGEVRQGLTGALLPPWPQGALVEEGSCREDGTGSCCGHRLQPGSAGRGAPGPWPPECGAWPQGCRRLALATAHRSWSRSWVSFSLAFRCRMHTSFCCRGVRYCSGVGGLMPWLSLHSVYFKERLQGDACHQEGQRKGKGPRQEASLAILVPPPPEGSRSASLPRPVGSRGHPALFWKVGLSKFL